jgi:hypothetical protein
VRLHGTRYPGLALVGLLVVLTTSILWAARAARSTTSSPSAPAIERPRPGAEEAMRPGARSGRPEVSTLLRLDSSAYHARLFADAVGAVLVTPVGFVLLRDGAQPRERGVPLGPVSARHGDSLVFWRSGWLRQIALSGEDERPLVALSRAPQHLLASASRIAWIDSERDGGASLQTLTGGEVRVVRESEHRVIAAALRDERVYWIEQARDGTWTIAGIHVDGHDERLTTARAGRPPAMLAVGRDGVYFYEGPVRGIRRLTFDLAREDAVASNVICSPLVTSDGTICAQVGGLFEIPAVGETPRFVASEREGPITTLAATDERLFWVTDSGTDRLVVRSVLLRGQ